MLWVLHVEEADVPDLMADTRIEPTGGTGRYASSLSPDWAVWGPNGGYLAALALRAAIGQSRFDRPASFYCHFLAVGAFEEVELEVTSLGGGKRAESLRIDVHQGDHRLLAATVWMVDEGLGGYEHEVVHPPDVAGVADLKSFSELAGDEYEQWYPIWRSIEGKPLRWREPPADPEWHCWLRLTETPIEDVRADAMRQVLWLDMVGWNAVIAAHEWPFPFLTPNLDLMVQFHQFAPEEPWQARDGLVGCVARLWTPDGRLLATGASKHSARPNPNYAQELANAREQGLIS
jgi:acyl-CoA thioesterase